MVQSWCCTSHGCSPKAAQDPQGLGSTLPCCSASAAPCGPARAVTLSDCRGKHSRQDVCNPEGGPGVRKGKQLGRERTVTQAYLCPGLSIHSPIPEASSVIHLRKNETRTCLDLVVPAVIEITYFYQKFEAIQLPSPRYTSKIPTIDIACLGQNTAPKPLLNG